MKQHRRQQVVTKQKDRERLQSRIRLALARLAREQRDEMVRLKKFVQVLVLKARGLIATAKPNKRPEKKTLYEEKVWQTFSNDPTSKPSLDYLNVPESRIEEFLAFILPPPPRASSASRRTRSGSRPASADSSPARSPFTGAGSAKRLPRSRGAVEQQEKPFLHCDNCGSRIRNLCILPAEEDQTTKLLLQVNPYDTAVLTATSDVALFPPQPKGGEPPPAPAVPQGRKAALGYFASWGCARQWNAKHSPTFVRSRRDLVIDLLESKAQPNNGLHPITLT
jgi:hypothetical protein